MPSVVVTGASSGLGRAIADRLHADGWSVTGLSRSGGGGNGWSSVVADVDDDASVAAAISGAVDKSGRLDAVVTAAGWGLAGPAEDTPVEQAKAQFETNYWGTVRTIQYALPYLRQARGRAVLLGSVAGVIGIPFQSHYSASKFALEGWAESLAWEVEPLDVRVTIVQPGNFRTGFTSARRAVMVPHESPYAASVRRAVEQMERDETDGADPDQAAALVSRVLAMRRPPLRVMVGPTGDRAGIWAKRLLPYRVFERLARGSLLGE
jgi:NAD(P)-dependent dehydrogenase (short-subunit alcohol dehydrogenase family)